MNRILSLFISVFFVLLFSQCIPVEDKINPTVSQVILNQTSFYYGDSLKMQLLMTDNGNLERIEIRAVKNTSLDVITPTDWNFTFVDSTLAGGYFRYNFDTLVPYDVALGDYELLISVYDTEGNIGNYAAQFRIEVNIGAPTFVGLAISATSNDTLCRAMNVGLDGFAYDPNGIDKCTYSFAGYPPHVIDYAVDTVHFDVELAGEIFVPSDMPNGPTTLTLCFTDNSGNESCQIINLVVECDDQAPRISVSATQPALSADGTSCNVVENGTLYITSAIIEDDVHVDSVFIYKYPVGGTPTLIFADKVPGTGITILDLDYFLGMLEFSVGFFGSVAGEMYNLVILAKDESGNISEPYAINVGIVVDQAPEILITDVEINGVLYSSITEIPSFSEADLPIRIRVSGKAFEDNYLAYAGMSLEMTYPSFGPVAANGVDLGGDLIFNYMSLDQSAFEITSTITGTLTTFMFKLEAQDNRGTIGTSSQVFYINVYPI